MHIKIADYGISRVALPTGTKGFGGTEGFMAPEIMKHNGEEEYTEKVNETSNFESSLKLIRNDFTGRLFFIWHVLVRANYTTTAI